MARLRLPGVCSQRPTSRSVHLGSLVLLPPHSFPVHGCSSSCQASYPAPSPPLCHASTSAHTADPRFPPPTPPAQCHRRRPSPEREAKALSRSDANPLGPTHPLLGVFFSLRRQADAPVPLPRESPVQRAMADDLHCCHHYCCTRLAPPARSLHPALPFLSSGGSHVLIPISVLPSSAAPPLLATAGLHSQIF